MTEHLRLNENIFENNVNFFSLNLSKKERQHISVVRHVYICSMNVGNIVTSHVNYTFFVSLTMNRNSFINKNNEKGKYTQVILKVTAA